MNRPIRRGDVYTVDLEPVRGAEQGKARPAVIIQNDLGNRYSPTVIVAAITSTLRPDFDVNVIVAAPEGELAHDSTVLLNQIRTVDRSRLGRYWGRLGSETMARIDHALMISLGLTPI